MNSKPPNQPPDAPHGPIEDNPWPSQLTAHVVEPGTAPAIHGYDLQADLALHYSFAEVVLLSITGEIPSRAQGRAFEIVLVFGAGTSVAEAPAHAAGLAQLMATSSNGVLGTGALALAEQAHFVIRAHDELLVWLRDPTVPFADAYRADDEEERAAVARLTAALQPTAICPATLDHDPTLTAAIISVLYECGARKPHQLETVWCISRLATVSAEAFCVRPTDFPSYPMNLPPYTYVEPEPDER